VITGLVGWGRLARQHLRGRGSRTSVQNTGQLGVGTGRILGQREDDCAPGSAEYCFLIYPGGLAHGGMLMYERLLVAVDHSEVSDRVIGMSQSPAGQR
jgi:hypothetical protein